MTMWSDLPPHASAGARRARSETAPWAPATLHTQQSRVQRNAERQSNVPQLSLADDCHTIGHVNACIVAVQNFLAECMTANLVCRCLTKVRLSASALRWLVLQSAGTSRLQPDVHNSGGRASKPDGLGQAAMRDGSRQSMRAGRHHHDFAGLAK